MKIKATYTHGPLSDLKRAHDYDAGIDIPIQERLILRYEETVVIPTGLSIELPAGTMGMLVARSSMAKKGLDVAMSPIDSGYKGQIHIVLTNNSPTRLILEPGTRVAQLVVLPIILAELVDEVDDTRGVGAFGSTNVK